jgi:hypothetical protein
VFLDFSRDPSFTAEFDPAETSSNQNRSFAKPRSNYSDTPSFASSQGTSFASEFDRLLKFPTQYTYFEDPQFGYNDSPWLGLMPGPAETNGIESNSSLTRNRPYSNRQLLSSSVRLTRTQHFQGVGASDAQPVPDTNIDPYDMEGSKECFENEQGGGANYATGQRR